MAGSIFSLRLISLPVFKEGLRIYIRFPSNLYYFLIESILLSHRNHITYKYKLYYFILKLMLSARSRMSISPKLNVDQPVAEC